MKKLPKEYKKILKTMTLVQQKMASILLQVNGPTSAERFIDWVEAEKLAARPKQMDMFE